MTWDPPPATGDQDHGRPEPWGDLAAEVAALKDVFTRRLYEDKARASLYESLQVIARQQSDQLTGAIFENVIREVLLALDRLSTEPVSPELARSAVEEILEVFTRRGLTEVPTDEGFDPRIHEVVTAVPVSPGQPERIIDVLRPGYYLGERVLRPARVTITTSRRPAPASSGEPEQIATDPQDRG